MAFKVFAILFVLGAFAGAVLAQYDLTTDVDAFLLVRGICFGGFLFPWEDIYREIRNSQRHPLGYSWDYSELIPRGSFVRSYIYFTRDEVPLCFAKAYLRLYFPAAPSPPPALVRIYGVPWDGSSFGWWTRPWPENYIGSVSVGGPGWVEIEVTSWVKDVISNSDELAFMIRLDGDICPGETGSARAFFTEPHLHFIPCIQLSVEDELDDFVVTQPFLAGNRYASLGNLRVEVKAEVPYEVRACYEVSPEPAPSFPTSPVDIAYTWVWYNLPRCAVDGSSYIVLPCFSGTPGDETCTFRVRVDLADLGDRAAEEEFTFTVRVWAVPQ